MQTVKMKRWLDKANLKKTKHRVMVLDLLDKSSDLLSAEDIYMKLKQDDESVSLSTVYRILESFVQSELVTTVNVEFSKQVLYELKHEAHCHHLICTQCHKVIHVHSCPLTSYQKTLENEHGFTISNHTLDFYGVCDACKES